MLFANLVSNTFGMVLNTGSVERTGLGCQVASEEYVQKGFPFVYQKGYGACTGYTSNSTAKVVNLALVGIVVATIGLALATNRKK